MEYVHLRGVEIIHQIQHTFRHHVDLMQFLTRVGDPRYAFHIYFPLAYCFHRYTGTRVLWIACLSEWLNGVLKWILHGERPYWWVNEARLHDHVVNVPSLEQYSLTCETGPGYKKNTLKLRIGGKLERALVWISFTILLVAINISRLFIATHFPHQVIAGSITGIHLSEVVKHEYTSHLSFHHFVVWSLLLASGVVLTYTEITLLGLDLRWSLGLAKKWSAKSEWVHPDTTPFFAFVRDVSSLIGKFWCWCFIKWESKNFERVEYGPKTGASCDISCFDSDCRKHQNLFVFSTVYVVGFLKFTIMMIGIVYIIPQLLSRNKVE